MTTARDVGLHTLEVFRSRYWLIAFGTNPDSGYKISELYFLHPRHLEPWLSKIGEKIENDHKLLNKMIKWSGSKLTPTESEIIQYIFKRDTTINNPKIPGGLVISAGELLPHSDRELTKMKLTDLVHHNPLELQ